jgi:hypothetical protein
MTARHQIHIGARRIGRDRPMISATPAPTTGEMLQAAREKKGVDLYRAERDTKIRAKYLAALENSDSEELPSPVYSKGFLRNYALYLGLDPDEVLTRWKGEVIAPRVAAKPIAVRPPQPLAAPRHGLTLTPGLLFAGILTLVIVAFGGYVVLQLFRFSQPPQLAMTSPVARVMTIEADHFLLTGTANPGATVAIEGAGQQTYRVTADGSGAWSREVPLTKGQNDFRIVATDTDTGKQSDATNLIITVPLPIGTIVPGQSAAVGSGPSMLLPVQLALAQPANGASFADGTVTIAGTTNGATVTVTAVAATPSGSTSPQRSPGPSGKPKGSPAPAAQPAPLVITPQSGVFSGTMDLSTGMWTLAIVSSGPGMAALTETRTVSVTARSVTVSVMAKKAPSWIKVWVDGQLLPGYAVGKILPKGTSVSFTGKRTVTIRTGNAGATSFIVNGVNKGILGLAGRVESWQFQSGREPLKTSGQ